MDKINTKTISDFISYCNSYGIKAVFYNEKCFKSDIDYVLDAKLVGFTQKPIEQMLVYEHRFPIPDSMIWPFTIRLALSGINLISMDVKEDNYLEAMSID